MLLQQHHHHHIVTAGMNIIIPLGGLGSRFQTEGYARPKPFVRVLGKEMILWVPCTRPAVPCCTPCCAPRCRPPPPPAPQRRVTLVPCARRWWITSLSRRATHW